MLAIMIIFDFSCISRACFDYLVSQEIVDDGYEVKWLICLIFSAVILDFIPITVMLIFHTLNFKTMKVRSDSLRLN